MPNFAYVRELLVRQAGQRSKWWVEGANLYGGVRKEQAELRAVEKRGISLTHRQKSLVSGIRTLMENEVQTQTEYDLQTICMVNILQ